MSQENKINPRCDRCGVRRLIHAQVTGEDHAFNPPEGWEPPPDDVPKGELEPESFSIEVDSERQTPQMSSVEESCSLALECWNVLAAILDNLGLDPDGGIGYGAWLASALSTAAQERKVTAVPACRLIVHYEPGDRWGVWDRAKAIERSYEHEGPEGTQEEESQPPSSGLSGPE